MWFDKLTMTVSVTLSPAFRGIEGWMTNCDTVSAGREEKTSVVIRLIAFVLV